jgi:hypothetical protein
MRDASERRRRLIHPAFSAAIWVAILVLAGCDAWNNRECDRLEESWCEDGVRYYCENRNDGFLSRGSALYKTVCEEGSTCIEWGDSEALCMEDDACNGKEGFCLYDEGDAIAVCPSGGGLPDVRSCGEADPEGPYCVEDANRAICVYDEEPCSPEQASRCAYPARCFYSCRDGFWRERGWCDYGETCVQLSESEVGCFLETLPGW